MKATTRVSAALAAAAVVLACTCGSASAFGARPGHSFGHPFDPRSDHPVFVQTDNTSGNQVVAYDQAGNGSLTQAGVYNTGGLGGTLTGSVVDHLASQGSLAYDREDGLLYAVNAGSNTISVFARLWRSLRPAPGSSSAGHSRSASPSIAVSCTC